MSTVLITGASRGIGRATALQLAAAGWAGLRRLTKVIHEQVVPTERVAATIEQALSDRRPRARYPVGALSRFQIAITPLVSTSMADAALARMTGIPRKP